MRRLYCSKPNNFILKISFYLIILLIFEGILGDRTVLAETVKLNKTSVILTQGESVSLHLNETKKKISWATGNKTIAVVSKTGKVVGKSVGTVNITAVSGRKKYSCKVTVKKKSPSIKSLEFQTEEVTLYPKDEFQLKLEVKPINGDRKGLVYLSSNKAVAGVTTKGKIVAHDIGDTIIYAQSENGKKCSVKIKVLAIPELKVKGKSIQIGDSVDTVMKTFGYPDRADISVYGGKVYIYNNIPSSLLMVLINDEEVSGYFTDTMVFSSLGITPDTAIEDIPDYFVQDNESEWIRTYEAKGKYKANILMDSISTKVIRGIYVLKDGMAMEQNGDALMGQELEFFDIIYSMRIKQGLITMKWSASAASAARMHGMDMIIKNYVSSGNFEGKSPADRLRDVGVQSTLNSENILIAYEDPIFAAYKTLNTYEYRVNMVNSAWTSLGVGVSINQEGKFYYVQEYYTP